MSEVETAGTGADQPAGVAQRSVTICNKRGLHARAAARFVKLAWQFDAEVTVRKNGTTVSGRVVGTIPIPRKRYSTASPAALITTQKVRRSFKARRPP